MPICKFWTMNFVTTDKKKENSQLVQINKNWCKITSKVYIVMMIYNTRKRISTGNERRNIMGVPETRGIEKLCPYGIQHQ